MNEIVCVGLLIPIETTGPVEEGGLFCCSTTQSAVNPATGGVQLWAAVTLKVSWIPAFAGMTALRGAGIPASNGYLPYLQRGCHADRR